MKSFRELLGLERDPLLRQADSLVQAAETYASETFTLLLKKFSFLREVDKKRWDLTVTIAGVFIAVTQLTHLGLGENRQRKLMERVGAKLIQWNPTNGRRGFENCASFYEKAFNELTSVSEPQFVGSDALGSWVVWSVLSRPAQSEEEHRLVRTVGGMIIPTFINWWEKKS
jgi:hypothetical protein